MALVVTAGAPVRPAEGAAPTSARQPVAAVAHPVTAAQPDWPEDEQPGIRPVDRDRPRTPTAGPSPTPTGPAAEVGIRLLDAPVNRRDDSRAHKYVVDHVKPGTTIKRRVVVKNPSTIRRDVAVYAAAADVDEGGFRFAPERSENELSSWIDVDRTEANLAPDEEETVQVTITVPRQASAGERYAVVWAEVSGVDEENVRNIGRTGVRVYLSVGPGGEPPSSFDIGGLTGSRPPDGNPVVTAEVRNTGRRALDLAGQLWLTDGPGGLAVGPVRAEAKTLAPGASTTVHVVLDSRLPDGRWTAKLDLASGWTKGTVTATVTFGATPALVADDEPAPWVLTGGLIASALVLTLLGGYAYRRRTRSVTVAPA
ncbi:hypothetical protein ABT336_22515 [Micromonospora sp. NPDC000207]|uniref:hypothetical protein n=1 Tax=Micromonospora sp. NPDC000207 TaxID=3154246 RepID=UPI00331ABE87